MIQLNAEQYKTVQRALELLEAPRQGSQRLAVYAFAKEVVAYGCAAAEQSEQCTRCASYLLPMCQAVQQVTHINQPNCQNTAPNGHVVKAPEFSNHYITDSSL